MESTDEKEMSMDRAQEIFSECCFYTDLLKKESEDYPELKALLDEVDL